MALMIDNVIRRNIEMNKWYSMMKAANENEMMWQNSENDVIMKAKKCQ